MSRSAAVPLLLLLPLVWQAGLGLARLATRDLRLAKVLGPGFGLAILLLAIHLIGLATHSFYAGLFAGTLAVAGLGGLAMRRGPVSEKPGRVLPWWAFVGMLVAVAFLAGPLLRWSEHDECLVTGHVSLPLQMQNGIYPPRYSTFPQFEVRYHYAIDLAAAVMSSLLGDLDMQPTVHLLAALLWAYTFLVLWVVGCRFVGGRGAGAVTAFGVLLAGGAPFFCRSLHPLSLYLMSDCAPGGTWITPPLISNFLQHPWSLGIPIFLMLLLLWDLRESESRNPWWWLAFSLLFAALSLSQVVLFVCFLPTVVAVGSLRGGRISLRRLGILAVWAVAILLTARLLHGFFAPGTEPHAGDIVFHPYWLDAKAAGFWAWNADAMGFLLPLGLVGFFFFRGPRLALVILAAGGLLARNMLAYAHSWDIVKFSMVSQLALALLSAAAVSRALQYRWTRPLGAVALALCVAFGIGWSVSLGFDLPGLWFCRDLVARPRGSDAEAIAWLRRHVREGEGVFRTENSDAYAIYGGLPSPGWDWGVGSFGFSQRLFDERTRLQQHPSKNPDDYLAQFFPWLVLGDNDRELRGNAERWAEEGKAELAAEFPPLRVYRLRPPAGSR